MTALLVMALSLGIQAYAAEDEKQEMLQELYEGILDSDRQSYRTERQYPIGRWENWLMELQINYFHSTKPGKAVCYWSPGTDEAYVELQTEADREQIRMKDAEYRTKLKEIAGSVSGLPKESKIRYFHDYLINHCSYDPSATQFYAYDCLIRGVSVCNGYMIAFHNLCREAGIESECVLGEANQTYHGWNRVKLDDGAWRYVDVTWNDLSGSDQYYLITEEQMSQDHTASRYIS